MWRFLAVAAVISGISIVAADSASRNPTPRAAGVMHAFRLAVSDARSATIRIIDLDDGRLLSTFSLSSPARLHTGPSRRYVYAVQSEADEVAAIDIGIALESHGDHADLKVSAPRLLSHRLRGSRPSHLTHNDARIAVFFDGDGTTQIFSEQDFVDGRTARIRRIETGAKHHGVAIPIGRRLAVTVPPTGDGLPDAIELRSDDTPERPRVACPSLHGEAVTGRFVAFGCGDGVAILESVRNAVAARSVAYPASLPPGRMIRRMTGAAGFTFFAGDFGADGMVILDPSATDGDFRFISLPARRMDFNLHPESGERLFVIVEDGTLLSLNPLTGAIEAQARVTGRYAMDQGTIRPRIASVGTYVAVSDPRAGEVVVLDATTLAERHRVKVGGAPSDLLALGGDGATH
jgi:hypothetical protein